MTGTFDRRARNPVTRALVFLGLLLCASTTGHSEEAQVAKAAASTSDVEQIYILRSVREKRTMPPSDFCAKEKTKLSDPAYEDNYAFRAVATQAADGRVLDATTQPAGDIHACFGRTADAAVLELYGEFAVHGIAGKAFGKCHRQKSDFPEKGINLFGCIFELYELPPEYVGGQLTTNSVSSPKLFGTESEPSGYTQVSIATVRLWKKSAK